MNNENASSSTINETPYFNFDSSDLGDLVKTRAFVDKTIMIKEILRITSKMILITAPHRFGKSSNLDMLKKFVEIQVDQNGLVISKDVSSNYHIFKDNNLLIFRDTYFFERHFATDPTIHVDFKLITGDTFDEVLDKFRFVLHETFKQHGYLLGSDKLIETEKMHFQQFSDEKSYGNLNEKDIEEGLTFLLECLYKYFNGKKVFIFIDEYDAPITNTMFKENIEIERVRKLFNMGYLKDNKYVKRVLLTGIYQFRFLCVYKHTYYCTEYAFLTDHSLVPYYGLTEDEVTKLLTNFDIDSETKEKVKSHYNGYLSPTGIKIHSIWSILKFLEQKEIQNYWEDSGMVTNLMNVLVERSSIEALYLGKSVSINSEEINLNDLNELKRKYLQNEDFTIYTSYVYINFLIQEGYLALEKDTQRVRIPNAEIFSRFQKKILDHYGESINSSVANCAVSFNKISSSREDKIFVDFITDFNEVLNKLKNRYNRDAYHCIMFFILLKSKFSLITKYNDNTDCVDLIARYSDLLIFIHVTYGRSEYALDQMETEYLKMYNGKSLLKNGKISVCIGLNVSQNNIADISVLVRKARHFGI